MVDFSKRLATAMALPRKNGGPTTVKMLALACGCTYQAVKKWTLSPTATLNAAHNAAAAKFLGVRSDWLAIGAEPMKDHTADVYDTSKVQKVRPTHEVTSWPFASVTPTQWASISLEARAMLEMQITALVPITKQHKRKA